MLNYSNNNDEYRIGEIYLMKFDGADNEQTGWRPGLVFQNNKGNKYSPNIIALPLTSAIKKLHLPTHVFIAAHACGLYKDSVVLCENPQRMSKSRIGQYITTLSDEIMGSIAIASLLATSAISFITREQLFNVYEMALGFNAA